MAAKKSEGYRGSTLFAKRLQHLEREAEERTVDAMMEEHGRKAKETRQE